MLKGRISRPLLSLPLHSMILYSMPYSLWYILPAKEWIGNTASRRQHLKERTTKTPSRCLHASHFKGELFAISVIRYSLNDIPL